MSGRLHGKREKFLPRNDPSSYYGRPILKPPANR
jgi:hypothetical protein